jgi:short-subunit dehydrogenase
MGYTNSLREEVRKYGIKVINVIPGATETPMWSQEVRKKYSERMIGTSEIARLLVWLYLQKGNLVSEEILVRPILGDL